MLYEYIDTKLFAICSEVPHSQILHHVATSQLNRNKNQITCFHKTRDTRAGNLRTDYSNKTQ